ncbi:type II toxin-antitoxin system RelE/ParE family toxin [Methylobacterium aerolatum]|uniref:Toxin ParE1/3/4 n=1 Tax=Methylobacterium aerolatum TaxID=418708 RepID=A0ABU0I474_9HYPH|nr:type II toxin-antitoxin system RelE/ParE family toxin [Methylobacterium aerolatum]MDQ0449400.1 toxin ParE1/3/4 [Methylobacterium aerolatum]GJD36652.1 hypothetical protein FMGBMHLM_3575 [Methylobacterium aerolatum]
MKRRRVVYTPDAANDLDSLYDYIADTAGPAVAADYEERILRFCAGLGLGAERGSLRDDIRPGLQVIGFERRVAVAFAVEDDRIVILRISSGGRDWSGALR